MLCRETRQKGKNHRGTEEEEIAQRRFSFLRMQKRRCSAAKHRFYRLKRLIPTLSVGTLKFNNNPLLKFSRRRYVSI